MAFSCTFSAYADAARSGDVALFERIERSSSGRLFPTLDCGEGAALHFAADGGSVAMARHLIETRAVPVNQQARRCGWTPLHRAASGAAARGPRDVFSYLLSRGACPEILTAEGWEGAGGYGRPGKPCSVFELCPERGLGWRPGRLRGTLLALAQSHAAVPKGAPFVFGSPSAAGSAADAAGAAAGEAPAPDGPPRGASSIRRSNTAMTDDWEVIEGPGEAAEEGPGGGDVGEGSLSAAELTYPLGSW